MLRIVHYQPYMNWSAGGLMRAVLDLCATLARQRHHIRFFTVDSTDLPPEWLSGGDGLPQATVLDPLRWLNRLPHPAVDRVAEALKSADVLHLHAPWIPSNVQLARFARQMNRPYVLTIHGMLDDWCMSQRRTKKQIYLKLFGRDLLNGAAMIHCTAESERRQAQKWFNHDRISVLPYLFDMSELLQLPGPEMARQQFKALDAAVPKVLFLSRLHPKKGLEHLLDAASILRRRNVALRVVVAGDGEPAYLESLHRRVSRLGLEEIVHFLGPVKGALKWSIYQAADLFVLPTSQENYGLVFPESLAAGTPVVTTPGVDIWEELQQAGAEIVEQAPEAIADAVARLLADPARRSELGRRGRNWVLETLDPDKLVTRYEAMYRSVIDGRGSP